MGIFEIVIECAGSNIIVACQKLLIGFNRLCRRERRYVRVGHRCGVVDDYDLWF